MLNSYRSIVIIGSICILLTAAVYLAPTRAATRGMATSAPVSPLNRLAPENVALAKQVGLWSVTETIWPSPKAAPITTTGLVAERRMIGAMLEEIQRPAADTAQNDIQRVDYLTFNHISGRWEYVSMDTRADVGLMPAWSFSRATEDGKIVLEHEPFVFPSDGPNPKPLMLRMNSIITHQDIDHDMKEQYFVSTDGTGTVWLAHRYAYSRQH